MNAYTVTVIPYRAGSLLWRFPVAAHSADQARETARAQLCMVRDADACEVECWAAGAEWEQMTLFQQEVSGG